MNIHKITSTATAIILTIFTFGVAAQTGNNDNAGRAGQNQHNNKPGMHESGDARMQGRDNAARDHDAGRNQGYRQGNENSNRQSDPGSTRGLERAAERRSEHSKNADSKGQAERRSEDTGPQRQAEKKSRWYDFMLGRDKKAEGDMESGYETTEEKQRWWWPFN